MTIKYNYERIEVPSSRMESGRQFYKYLFVLVNEGYDSVHGFRIDIAFEKASLITKAFVAPSSIVLSLHEANVSLEISELKKDQEIKLHVYIYENSESVDVKSNSSGISLIERKKEIINHKHSVQVGLPLKYSILVASALHEELNQLLKDQHWSYANEDQLTKTYRVGDVKGNVFHIICYSSNKMGMAFNGVALTKMIEQYKPSFVLFIGTCAGFRKTKTLKQGDVLVPEYIYEYSSGKHRAKKFEIEYRHYDVSPVLTTFVNDMLSKRFRPFKFNVKDTCGFCSGSSVVNSVKMKKSIEDSANRKVLGFDMEAYVIAVINHLYDDVETLVIKGIMDFGSKKNDLFKKTAIKNSTIFTNELIEYIINNQKIKS